jgi:hypothetical protein
MKQSNEKINYDKGHEQEGTAKLLQLFIFLQKSKREGDREENIMLLTNVTSIVTAS